jgi:K+-transporting ATPase ATPase C chain
MKKELLSSLLLSIACLVLFCVVYPLIVWVLAQFSPNKGEGFVVMANGKKYYENIGQKFTQDRYFQSRPSAVDYNAAGSGGSNKGPANPDLLNLVSARIDSFMIHNPNVNKADIPVDLVTASGSGLDPDISAAAAMVQCERIARVRGVSQATVNKIVQEQTEKPVLGMGPGKVNVLKLNIALDGSIK